MSHSSGPAGQPGETASGTEDNPATAQSAQPVQPAGPVPRVRSARRLAKSGIFFGADGLHAGWGILLFLALYEGFLYGASPLLGLIFSHSSGAEALTIPSGMLAFEGVALLSVALATWVMAKIERRPTSVYGLGGEHRQRNFLSGFGWGFVLLSLLVFSLRACGLLVFDARLQSGLHALYYGAAWLVGFLLVGLFEETLFRGYLQFALARGIDGIYRWIRSFGTHTTDATDATEWSEEEVREASSRAAVSLATELLGTGPHAADSRAAGLRSTSQSAFGFWVAAVALSLGFGLLHRSNAGESPIGLLAAAGVGVVFCLSLWRTGSLWWAIGFHAAWDWAQSFFYGVSDSGIAIQGHLYSTHPTGRPLFSGGATGPEGSLFVLPIIGLAAVVILLTLPRTHRGHPGAHGPAVGLNLP